MAFSPDQRTRSRNIYLQRQLNATCDFLDKERQHFKKRYEEKQRECVLLYTKLQKDFKRFGVEPDSRRPQTAAASSVQEVRTRCFSDPLSGSGQLNKSSDSRRRSSSCRQAWVDKNDCLKETKVYKFERLNVSSPDTEAYTVYCHSPQRRLSSAKPTARLSYQPSNSFSNYTSDVKWEDVKTISFYMNRSERRDSLIDIRTPIVLNTVRPATVGAKQRSKSYSGPSQGTVSDSKYPSYRPRAATIGSEFLETRKKNILPTLPTAFKSISNQDLNTKENSHSETEGSHESLETGDKDFTDTSDNLSKTDTTPNKQKQLDERSSLGKLSLNEEQNPALEPERETGSRINQSTVSNITQRLRRQSAPVVKSVKTGVARSSYEARKQRRFSHAKPAPRWTIDEADDSDNSDSDDLNQPGEYDATTYVQKQVESFISNLKCSDAMEDHVISYKSAEIGEITSNLGSKDNTTTEMKPNPQVKNMPAVVTARKEISVSSIHKIAPKNKNSPSVSNNKLTGLLKRPQFQFQMLLNKIKDANRAAERADRLKPKVKPPKCTF